MKQISIFAVLLCTSIFLLGTFALSQTYSGTFVQQDDPSTVITLASQNDGYTGALLNGGTDEFPIEAVLQEGYLTGYFRGSTIGYDDLFFIAQLAGDTLELAVAPIDAAGNPIETEAEAFVFVRSAESTAANPLPSTVPASQNPLAQANTDTFSGDYEGQAFSLSLQTAGSGYHGTLLMNGETYPLEATLKAERLVGTFTANGQSFAFEATLSGTTLTLVSEGTSYTLSKSETSANPLAGAPSTNPLTDGPESLVIAKGSYADLTEDNALAVYEAYAFSLQQLGYTEAFTEADKQAFFDLAIQEYPNTDQETQLILERAREVWTQVQANWESASLEEQRGFVLAVLALVHGEEAVAQTLGTGETSNDTQAGKTTMLNEMGCASVETCMSHLDPEGYEDMVNAQNCWSGCDYDADTNTFYEEPYYNTPSYDSYD